MKILELIENWENSNVEFKEDINNSDSIAWKIIQESNIEEIDRKKVENFIMKMYGKKINETWISYETLLQNLDICKKRVNLKKCNL